MASVIEVNGKPRAQVRVKGHPTKTKTFEPGEHKQAWKWALKLEAELKRQKPREVSADTLLLGEVIAAYRTLREKGRPILDTSTEHYTLKMLDRLLGHRAVAELTPDEMVAFGAARRDEGAGPYTINMDVSKLGTVLRYGGAALKVALPDVVGAARPLLSHMRLIGGGGLRDRRPTEDEMVRIVPRMAERFGPDYAEAVAFAAVSAMRRGEVCALTDAMIDVPTRIASIWRKHPRKGKVLEKVPLLGEAWEIVQRRPRAEDGRLFAIHPQTLSKYFKAACDDLGIPDLHLHDLRHEGTSRLFEDGMQIQEVALVTGHKDWRNLKRYTNLRPEDLTRQHAADKHQSTPQRRGSRPKPSPVPGKS